MSSEREKELCRLIYLRNELIKQCKKDIKQYHQELDMINGYKKIEKSKNNKNKLKKEGK